MQGMPHTDAELRWDAFLSYSSRDAIAVARIQRFLEGYRLPGGKRLRIYRDDTDIKSGELSAQLRHALACSGCLMVCCSEAAVKSEWVAREIAAFREQAPQRPVLPLLVHGELPDMIPFALRQQELRWADLRTGWLAALPRPKTRIELVRAVSAAAGIDFRELLPLDRKRRHRRAMLIAGTTLAALGVIALMPVLHWKNVTPANLPAVYGCGTLDDGIAFYRMNDAQAIRNIVLVEHGALGNSPRSEPLDASLLPRDRLLPARTGVAAAVCGAAGEWVGAPAEGLCISLNESDEIIGFDDPFGGGDLPLTEVSVGKERRVIEYAWTGVDYTLWQNYATRIHPSDGLPVSAQDNAVWLGFPANEFFRGTLWHSTDYGASWQQEPGITDVSSIQQLHIGTLIAARRKGELGFFLRGETEFLTFDVPGKGDDLEVCGEIDNLPVVRSDRQVFQQVRVPRWQTLGK